MVRIKDGAIEAANNALSKKIVERIGLKHNEIMRTTTSNRLAKGDATILNHDEDICGMRDCDKIG